MSSVQIVIGGFALLVLVWICVLCRREVVARRVRFRPIAAHVNEILARPYVEPPVVKQPVVAAPEQPVGDTPPTPDRCRRVVGPGCPKPQAPPAYVGAHRTPGHRAA